MAAHKKDGRINLLPKDEFAVSPMGRVLAWLLSTFRIIVILVEMVVTLAFFSRFWLDAKNGDLEEEIKTKKAQITAMANVEKQLKVVQDRLKIFVALTSQGTYYSGIINVVSAYLPADVFLTSYTAAANEVSVVGISPSEQSIAQYIANLENDQSVENLSLTRVDTGEQYEGLIGFTLTIVFKKG